MQKQALSTISDYDMLKPGDGIIVGLSGGADSVALTHFLFKFAIFEIKIVCVHVHHGLRGREADEDLGFCVDFCKQLGIDLMIFEKNAAAQAQEMGVGVEEAGRILRYDCFNQVLLQRGYNKIAVAHNQNDVAETIIMQIVRGAGGIRGIPPVNGNVIRPLVDVSREEILEYCRRHGLAYCIDSTNDSTDYSRNWIRNFLLPQIESNLNPSVGDAFGRLAKISAEEDVFLRNIAKNAYTKCVKSGEYGHVINLEVLAQYDIVIKRRIVRDTLGEALGGIRDITYGHGESVLALTGLQSGKQVSLPNGFIAEKVYNEICIKKPEIVDSFSVTLSKNNSVYVPQIDAWVYLGDTMVRENAFTKTLDYGKITKTETETETAVQIRTRLAGDRIYFNNVGTKKIKDFFADKKIARTDREKAVFIAYERDIILITGASSVFDKPIESHKFESNGSGNDKDNNKIIYLQIWKN